MQIEEGPSTASAMSIDKVLFPWLFYRYLSKCFEKITLWLYLRIKYSFWFKRMSLHVRVFVIYRINIFVKNKIFQSSLITMSTLWHKKNERFDLVFIINLPIALNQGIIRSLKTTNDKQYNGEMKKNKGYPLNHRTLQGRKGICLSCSVYVMWWMCSL